MAQEFSNVCNLDFYTDGSLINKGLTAATMGFAWIQTNPSAPQLRLAASATLGASAYKVELLATLLALQLAPLNCLVNIFTDCENILTHAGLINAGEFSNIRTI